MMGIVKFLSDFFHNSLKRQEALSDTSKEVLPGEKHTKLLDVCRTRWVARSEGLDLFIDVCHAVVQIL